MGYYEFEARGRAFFDEPETRSLSVFGKDYEIPLARIRPDFVEVQKVEKIDDHTAEITYDKDER